MAQHTNALTGARYPDNSSATDLATYYSWAVNDLSPMTIPYFSTKAARDTAFTNWVNAGNSMRDGLHCNVGGYDQVYRGGSWRGVGSVPHNTTAVDGSFHDTSAVVMTLSIADPGFAYQLQAAGSVLVNMSAGTTLFAQIQVNGNTLPPQGMNVHVDTDQQGIAVLLNTPAPGLTGTLSGTSTVTLNVGFAADPGAGYGFTAQQNTVYNQLFAVVVPA